MDKLKVGIAGFGIVGKRRKHFINLNPSMQVVAVCDKNFNGKGVLEDGVLYFSSYQELINEKLDCLFVCMTNDVAAEVTRLALENGLHVFCEKPPARNMDDLGPVLVCKKKYPHLKLKYGFNHRYHDSVIDALKIVQSGDLGKIINLRGIYGKSKLVSFGQKSDWRSDRAISGGGILLDQGIHMVDLLRLFAGEFQDIHSYISNNFWKYNVEDNAYALMRTKDGKVAMLHSSATQWRHSFQLDIHLEKGAIILSGILSGTKSYGAEKMTISWVADSDLGDPREYTTRYNKDNSWQREIDEFSDVILNNLEVRHGTLEDAWKTMELVYKIYASDHDWSMRWGIKPSLFNLDSISNLAVEHE